VEILPSGIASTAVIGTHALAVSEVLPIGIAPTIQFGDAKISPTIKAVGIAPTSVIGSHVIAITEILPNGIASTATLGSHAITITEILPGGIISTAVLGSPSITSAILPIGIGSTLAFGETTLRLSAVYPEGIVSTSAVGTPGIILPFRELFIDGTRVTILTGWNVIDSVNARSTAQFVVTDLGSLPAINNGDEIELKKGTVVYFSGIIKGVEAYEPIPGTIWYAVSTTDNSAKADKRRIAKSWTNEFAGDIARDIITEKLADEGVTAGTVQDGPLIQKAISSYLKCSELLNQIKDLTGYVWNINKDNELNFYQRSTFVAPWTLSDSVQHSNFRHHKNMDEYANTVYARGGFGETPTQYNEQPTPAVPDGLTRTFTLRYPVAEKPEIEIKINGGSWVAINPAQIGINGVDENKLWYWSHEQQTITQDTSIQPLTPEDEIRVTYVGLRKLFVKVDDSTEIAIRQAIENGTSGIYDRLVTDDSITTSAQIIEYAESQLEILAQEVDTVTFDTEVQGLEAGMILPIDKPLYGINGDFLIESVTMRPVGPDKIMYSVNALDGAAIGGWAQFFGKMISKQERFVIGESEVLIILQRFSEAQEHSSTTTIQYFEPPVCNTGVKCGTLKVGGNKLNEETIAE
jgi:hypothetical protein